MNLNVKKENLTLRRRTSRLQRVILEEIDSFSQEEGYPTLYGKLCDRVAKRFHKFGLWYRDVPETVRREGYTYEYVAPTPSFQASFSRSMRNLIEKGFVVRVPVEVTVSRVREDASEGREERGSDLERVSIRDGFELTSRAQAVLKGG